MSDGQKWEYDVQEFKGADASVMKAAVNKMAQDGWELVSVNLPLHYFKRARGRKVADVKNYGARDSYPTGHPVG